MSYSVIATPKYWDYKNLLRHPQATYNGFGMLHARDMKAVSFPDAEHRYCNISTKVLRYFVDNMRT